MASVNQIVTISVKFRDVEIDRRPTDISNETYTVQLDWTVTLIRNQSKIGEATVQPEIYIKKTLKNPR